MTHPSSGSELLLTCGRPEARPQGARPGPIARRNLLLAGELLALLDLLEANGVTAIPFKGPTLAVLLYGNLALRSFRDLDILVRRRDAARAQELLASRGYPAPERGATAPWHTRLARDDGAIVELHWAFAPPQFPFPLDPDEVWTRLQPVRLGGRVVHTLGTEDLLLYLCGHGAKHGWERLEWICDVAQLARRETGLNWDAITARARARGCERMVLLALLLARDLLEAPVPQPLVARARADTSVRALAQLVQSRLFTDPTAALDPWYASVFHLRVLERWRDRARYVLRVGLTPSLGDWELVRLPAALSFLYYLIRPVRLALKYGRLALTRPARIADFGLRSADYQ